ncbi:hypothetical protein [Aliiglaciecola sp. CAU 1673]|uniref:hypothetical protein n=1 Tax=Aliiglaciecola sp. CAU 1673 TaxID=3032595 RepID=UPI0023DC2EDC|nr:hypothetical protein [Aliiglaciecola sp. CAU 1673]
MLFSAWSVAQDSVPTRLTVGIQQINHYPHYDITSGHFRGFAADLLALFTEHEGLQLSYVALPVKRQSAALEDSVDLLYPDNPKWQALREGDDGRFFSQEVIRILGVSLVKPDLADITIDKVKTLAVVRGFTPTLWMDLQPDYRFQFVEVSDNLTAAMMALKDRVTAAEGEYNVLFHQLKRLSLADSLVVARQLPVSHVGYHLSSLKYPQIINRFDQFLVDQRQQIDELIEQYGLIQSLPKQSAP